MCADTLDPDAERVDAVLRGILARKCSQEAPLVAELGTHDGIVCAFCGLAARPNRPVFVCRDAVYCSSKCAMKADGQPLSAGRLASTLPNAPTETKGLLRLLLDAVIDRLKVTAGLAPAKIQSAPIDSESDGSDCCGSLNSDPLTASGSGRHGSEIR
jgi:hypothetical protein